MFTQKQYAVLAIVLVLGISTGWYAHMRYMRYVLAQSITEIGASFDAARQSLRDMAPTMPPESSSSSPPAQ
jgi:hypothetical protein